MGKTKILPHIYQSRYRNYLWKNLNLPIVLLETFLMFLSSSMFAPVFAQLGVACPENQIYIGIFDACFDFETAIGWFISWTLILGALVALVKFGIGAIQMILSTGQPTKLENARTTLTDAVIGLIMIATAWALLGYVSSTFPADWQIHFFVLPFGPGYIP